MKKIIISLLAVITLLAACNQQPTTTVDETVDVSQETKPVVEEEMPEKTEPIVEAPEKPEPVDIKVIAPYGTPVLTMVKMFVENPVIAVNAAVTYEAIQATDVLTSELVNGSADIAIVPTNLAAVLHSKEVGYRLAGSSVWGIFYIIATEEITSIEDLKGKTISLIGRGLTPDAMLRHILKENGIDPDTDVTLEYFSGSSELATNFIAGQGQIAMIPQPLLTNVLMKREDAKAVIDLQQAWADVTGMDSYPLSSIIVKQTLIDSHPEVVDAFLSEYADSVQWLNDNPAEAGAYYESLNIGLKAPIIQKAIPDCNLRFVSAKNAREDLTTFLTILYDFNPKIVGGKPIDEGLYFEK